MLIPIKKVGLIKNPAALIDEDKVNIINRLIAFLNSSPPIKKVISSPKFTINIVEINTYIIP